MKKTTWESPYQTANYWDAMARAGVESESLQLGSGDTIYFDKSSPVPTAWEVDSSVSIHPAEIGSRIVYQLVHSGSQMREDSYYTRALSKNDSRYNARFRRQLKKAHASLSRPTITIAESPDQFANAIALFTGHPERRDAIPEGLFQKRILSLAGAGLLLAYILQDDDHQDLGASLIIHHGGHANLRYYTAERSHGAGHLLQALSIDDLFLNQGINTVDLSGISPFAVDEKLQGIDEFKCQIGGGVREFQRIVDIDSYH
jgi:hypothetical protein